MKKSEFLDMLRSALNGNVSPSVLMENIKFYEDYINTEIQKGKTEKEVMDLLGDPRLFARTIIDTSEPVSDSNQSGNNMHAEKEAFQKNGFQNVFPRKRIPGWLWFLLFIIIFLGIISIIFSVVSFLLPVLLPVIIVVFFVKLFRDWLK